MRLPAKGSENLALVRCLGRKLTAQRHWLAGTASGESVSGGVAFSMRTHTEFAMRLPNPCQLARWSCFLGAVVAGGCDSGGGRVVPTAVVVASVAPPQGPNTPPGASITFQLAGSSLPITAADVVVSDGGNVLPGTLTAIGGASRWRWQPEHELPRGCTLTVDVAGERVASYGVRPPVAEGLFHLPGERCTQTLSWADGRRAIVTATGRVFAVAASGLTERFVTLPPDAHVFGDGDFLGDVVVDGNTYCLRGNLDGTFERVPTPSNAPIGGVDMAGNAVLMVAAGSGNSTAGLWRLMRTDAQFSFAGPLPQGELHDSPHIQANGTVSIAYATADRVGVATYRAGDVVAERHELARGASRAHMGVDSHGRGLLVFVDEPDPMAAAFEPRELRAARLDPGAGLRLLAPVVATMAFPVIDSVHVGEWGSAFVNMQTTSYVTGTVIPVIGYSAIRIEPDDHVAEEFSVHGGSGACAHITPRRAAYWGAKKAGRDVWGRRCSPNRFATNQTFYTAPWSVSSFTTFEFSFDDSGRSVIALNEPGSGVAIAILN